MAGPAPTTALRTEQVTIPAGHPWSRIPWIGGAVGIVGLLASLALASSDPKQFYFSWLVAFLFFLGLALGCLYFVLIHYATQAGWGVVVRRIAENFAATLPVFILLFVPILFGMQQLFPWSVPGAGEKDAMLAAKAPYLNASFFYLRAVVCFVCWSLIATYYARSSAAQDRTGDLSISRRLRKLSGPAIIVLALTQTIASIDWIMSLEPHWYSTIFGVYFFAGSIMACTALLAIVAVAMQRAGFLRDVVTREHLHDLGKLLFTFMVFWTYIAFSQFFLIWYANIPEETIWYKIRLDGSWKPVSAFLALGHFVIPFFFLMSRHIKRGAATLVVGASWMIAMHLLDVYWLVMPALHEHGLSIRLLDLTTFLAVGGFFFGAAAWRTRRQAVVPIRDPRLRESLSFENA